MLSSVTGIVSRYKVEEDICVVLVTQANRGVDKKCGGVLLDWMNTRDIQDSVRIEQDSYQVIGLDRDLKIDDKAYRDFMIKKVS